MAVGAMGELHLLLFLVVGLWQLPGAMAQTPTQTPTRAPTQQWLPLGTYPRVPFGDALIANATAPPFPYTPEKSSILTAK